MIGYLKIVQISLSNAYAGSFHNQDQIPRNNALGKDEHLIKINIFDEKFYILHLGSNVLYNFKQKKVSI